MYYFWIALIIFSVSYVYLSAYESARISDFKIFFYSVFNGLVLSMIFILANAVFNLP